MTGISVSSFIIVFLIFVRILSAFVAAPFFGHKVIPAYTKVFLSFITAYIIFLFTDTSQFNVEVSTWFIIFNVFKEIITGVIIGFSLHLIFYGISFAGSIIGFDIGLAMAQVFNPVDDTSTNIFGEILYFLALLLFLLINGHHYLIRALGYSFEVVPIGGLTFNESLYTTLVKYSASVFIIAVKIASPILVSFFLIHIAEGITAKIIPQMQVFFVTYPLKIGIGIFLVLSSFPVYVYIIKNLLRSYEDRLFELLKAMA